MLIAVLVTVIGLGLIVGPWMVRYRRDLAAERRQRIRSEERAEVAAHLHDSVLQTLILLQRNAATPREVAVLARRQERELRGWLYGGGRSSGDQGEAARPTTLAAAVRGLAAEVEELHDVSVELVVVGDAPLDARTDALAQATREAMVNACRHSGSDEVSVYLEAEGDTIEVFIRDRGRGFDVEAIAPDRHGVNESIRGRRRPSWRYGDAHECPGGGHRGDPRAAAMSEPTAVPTDGPKRLTVFLVDDHRLFRSGVRAELSETVDVVGEAGDVAEAVAGIGTTRPDVVLLDVHLPGGGGQAVIRQVHRDDPTVSFLALSVSDAADDVIAVIRAGARGYVTKTISPADLLDAIRRVSEGDAVFSARLAGFVLDAFSGEVPAPADPELDLLTPREREVLRLIARGYTYKELARRLSISVKTVETHVSSVLRKLQLSSRHELTRWATDRRL